MKRIKSYLLSLMTLMIMISSNSFADESVKDTIIYESEGLRILQPYPYAGLEDWCRIQNIRLASVYVLYDAPHDQRLQRMGSSYIEFVKDKVVPAIRERCGHDVVMSRVNINMLRDNGEFDSVISARDLTQFLLSHMRDTMMFEVTATGVKYVEYGVSQAAGFELSHEQIEALYAKYTPKSILEARRLAHVAFIEKNTVWPMGSCKGEYCEFGQYMNSIYHNDIEMIRKFDRVKLPSSTGNINHSLLRWVANYYLYNMACLSDDAVRKTATHTTDTYGLEMGGVYIGQGGGDVTRATYLINPKFVPLCDRVCNHGGGNPNRDIGLNGWKNSFPDIFGGIDKIKVARCNTPKKKQFERNLISMTLLFYDNQSTWFKPAKDYPISPTTH